MTVSVVIRTRNEAYRLRLTLLSLLGQTELAEVVIVDDGSTDHTQDVIAEAATRLPVVAVRNPQSAGRSAASNFGAVHATGDTLLFLDGDTPIAPGTVACHAAAHARPGIIGRGELFHLRCVRFLLDPETGTPQPGQEARLSRLPTSEVDAMRVTAAQITSDFASIEARAQLGIYPGAGPRRLGEIDLDALINHPDCEVLWAASSGSNMSVPRQAFQSIGGFDIDMDNNEHRELALRLYHTGHRMKLVTGGKSFHLTHRTGWRDPLLDMGWERAFLAAHPIPAVRLLPVMWASLADRSVLPEAWRILSLPDLAAAARGERPIDIEAARRLVLGDAAAAA